MRHKISCEIKNTEAKALVPKMSTECLLPFVGNIFVRSGNQIYGLLPDAGATQIVSVPMTGAFPVVSTQYQFRFKDPNTGNYVMGPSESNGFVIPTGTYIIEGYDLLNGDRFLGALNTTINTFGIFPVFNNFNSTDHSFYWNYDSNLGVWSNSVSRNIAAPPGQQNIAYLDANGNVLITGVTSGSWMLQSFLPSSYSGCTNPTPTPNPNPTPGPTPTPTPTPNPTPTPTPNPNPTPTPNSGGSSSSGGLKWYWWALIIVGIILLITIIAIIIVRATKKK